MSKVLITGAAGFLGSHLCERLLADGHEVIGMDNNVTGRTTNLESIFYKQEFTFHEHDVTEYIHVADGLDWVIHLASLASPKAYDTHPIKTLKVGALGTHKTLGLAKAKDANYLFASTSEVYGDPEVNPQPESYRGRTDCFGPRACYDESKRYGESLVRAYRNEHDISIRIARIFNTYGPRMNIDDGRVIPTFVRQALSSNDLTVYGDGSQTRSFCYVDDLINGFLALMKSDVQTPVNLGNPDERTIKNLAEVVLEVTESESGITHEPLPPDDPKVRRPDITKAKEQLGWEPEVGLHTGLERSLGYFEQAVR
jgi:dTDP-glucose 4,6-dehydratase